MIISLGPSCTVSQILALAVPDKLISLGPKKSNESGDHDHALFRDGLDLLMSTYLLKSNSLSPPITKI